MSALSARRIILVLTGALLAGVAATILQTFGIRAVYAVVIALSGAMPILLEGMRPSTTEEDGVGRVQQAIAEILGALAVGLFGAFALVLASVSEGILVAGATVAAYIGGFMARAAISSGNDAEDE